MNELNSLQVNKFKGLNLPLAIALLIVLFGLLAKINHWSYWFEIRLLGFLLVGFSYGTRYRLKVDKTIKDRVKAYMFFSFVIVEIITMLSINSVIYFQYFSLICGLIWLIVELIDCKVKKAKSNNLQNIFINLGFVLLMISVLSRIMAWSFISVSLMLGVFLTVIGFFIAYFSYIKECKN